MLLTPYFVIGQQEQKDKGSLNIHLGTNIIYNTYSIGYESSDLVQKVEKHQIRPNIKVGGWQSSLTQKNTGIIASMGFSYLYGEGNHLFEHSSELITHFDKGLKGQSLIYIGTLYRPYFGYRYQPLNQKIILKFGFGWKEIIQIGLGFRL